MAVKMRLRREGKKKQPFYRVVVADVRSPRDGRFIEDLGFYHPLRNPSEISIDRERALYWLRNGVQPSQAVVNLLRIEGIWEEFKPGAADENEARRAKRAEKRKAQEAKLEAARREQEEAAAEAARAKNAAAEAANAPEEAAEDEAADGAEGAEPEAAAEGADGAAAETAEPEAAAADEATSDAEAVEAAETAEAPVAEAAQSDAPTEGDAPAEEDAK